MCDTKLKSFPSENLIINNILVSISTFDIKYFLDLGLKFYWNEEIQNSSLSLIEDKILSY